MVAAARQAWTGGCAATVHWVRMSAELNDANKHELHESMLTGKSLESQG